MLNHLLIDTSLTRSRHLGVSKLVACGLVVNLIIVPAAMGQANEKRPDVHAEFVFGSFPYSSEGAALFQSEQARMLVAAFDRGWSLDKYLDETEESELDVLTMLDDLEQANLVRGPSDYELSPGLLLIRESDMAELSSGLEAAAAEFVDVIGEHWNEVEQFVGSLEAAQNLNADEMLYLAIVGGVLTGGVIDALMEDKTLVPGPPERARRGEGYYAWLVEGPDAGSWIIRQTARVGRYTVFSVGAGAHDDLRVQIDALRSEGHLVLESEDAEQWRIFSSVFSRDYIFPVFRSKRNELLELHATIRSGRYTAFAEFAAWYYQELVTRIVRSLVDQGYVAAPDPTFRFAIRTGR